MEGHFELDGHRTWYRTIGEPSPDASAAPVIVGHGGPGAAHDYLANVPELLADRAVVLWCGRGGLSAA